MGEAVRVVGALRRILNVEAEREEPLRDGFRWWADRQAQEIRVLPGSEAWEDLQVEFVSVATDVCLVEDGAALREALGQLPMRQPTLYGPVLDGRTRRLRLACAMPVHGGNRLLVERLLLIAAVMQIWDARFAVDAERGFLPPSLRSRPSFTRAAGPADVLADAALFVIYHGAWGSSWDEEEFGSLPARVEGDPRFLLVHGDREFFSAWLAFGSYFPSQCLMWRAARHPWFGFGLALDHALPVPDVPPELGMQVALELNAEEFLVRPMGYGLGSWLWEDSLIRFRAFYPRVSYWPGLLENIAYAEAQRALAAERWLRERHPELEPASWAAARVPGPC
ncbi:MAG: hypothetical protein RML12_06010 [Xanthomonadales bacterium]|nr:hypothetical protein [Xanthomonadales bacterium]